MNNKLFDSVRDRNEAFGYNTLLGHDYSWAKTQAAKTPVWLPSTNFSLQNSVLGVADLNARLFERKIQMSAEENPYANLNRRQSWLNLIANDLSKNDPYTKVVAPSPCVPLTGLRLYM